MDYQITMLYMELGDQVEPQSMCSINDGINKEIITGYPKIVFKYKETIVIKDRI